MGAELHGEEELFVGTTIGITCSFREDEYAFWLRAYYIDRIIAVGGIPFILPSSTSTEVIRDYAAICDGFILAGGGDMDPVFWGEEPRPGLGEIDPLRDQFELKLSEQILKKDIPALGICRGIQVLNVAAGGSVVQDLGQTGICHMQSAPKSHPFHDIFIEKDTRLFNILGQERVRVNSFHHQAVKQLGKGLIPSGTSGDGVIEAIESVQHRFLLGVQWHPECMTDRASERLFRALVEAARF